MLHIVHAANVVDQELVYVRYDYTPATNRGGRIKAAVETGFAVRLNGRFVRIRFSSSAKP
jgi:hypothetical protein